MTMDNFNETNVEWINSTAFQGEKNNTGIYTLKQRNAACEVRMSENGMKRNARTLLRQTGEKII